MKVNIINFEDYFNPELVVTNSIPVELKKFSETGVYSESIFGNFHTTDKFVTGWIHFGEYYVIHPIFFPYLKKVIPKLLRIIKTSRSIDLEGNITFVSELDDIGLIKFKENFDYYLEKYGIKTVKEYNFILKNKDKIFINMIPIYSSKLRPAILFSGKKDSSLIHDDINDLYNLIIKYSNDIKDADIELEGTLQVDVLMYNLQEYCNQLIKDIINGNIRKKKGFIRNSIFGSRVNFSARCIISPLVGYGIEEIKVPYRIYLELYKLFLINIVIKTKGISYREAESYWRTCTTHFDKEMYGYMKELVNKTEGGQWIILNRNPSISIGSCLLLKIIDVKDVYDDMVLEISNNILPSLTGDYDGDVLNMFPLFLNRWVKDFQTLRPDELLINANDGKFNKNFFLEKEQRLGIYILNN